VIETEILTLDRMAIEDAGLNPDKLAAAVHAQLGLKTGAVPIHAIARALDIVDIREEPLRSMEGALIMRPDRDVGAILANANSSRQRRRYTVAHELGHFLNLWHQPPNEGVLPVRRKIWARHGAAYRAMQADTASRKARQIASRSSYSRRRPA
jgi:hypothetical protein